jgi:hypothetical protein
MIGRRVLLLALIVAASTTFIAGVALERSGDADHHVTNAASTHREPAEGGENATDHAAETTGDAGAGAELRPLGIDVEAWPFVTTAVLASLALALAGWARPAHFGLLALTVAAMLAFAVVDVREIAHQLDINKNGLAVLAGLVAVLHFAAATVAASMALRARGPQGGLGGQAGTMAA